MTSLQYGGFPEQRQRNKDKNPRNLSDFAGKLTNFVSIDAT